MWCTCVLYHNGHSEVYSESVARCLACGEVIRAKEGRKKSKYSASSHVVSLWKSTISEELARVKFRRSSERERAGHPSASMHMSLESSCY